MPPKWGDLESEPPKGGGLRNTASEFQHQMVVIAIPVPVAFTVYAGIEINFRSKQNSQFKLKFLLCSKKVRVNRGKVAKIREHKKIIN